MKPEKCDICDHVHWRRDPHIFPDGIKIPEKEVEPVVVVKAEVDPEIHCPACNDQRYHKYIQAELDRKAAYMKSWRGGKKS